MKLKNGEFVFYEEPASFEDGLPIVSLNILKVEKVTKIGIEFMDKDDIVRYNYRVRYVFRNGERVENDDYDFMRITEDTIKLKGE